MSLPSRSKGVSSFRTGSRSEKNATLVFPRARAQRFLNTGGVYRCRCVRLRLGSRGLSPLLRLSYQVASGSSSPGATSRSPFPVPVQEACLVPYPWTSYPTRGQVDIGNVCFHSRWVGLVFLSTGHWKHTFSITEYSIGVHVLALSPTRNVIVYAGPAGRSNVLQSLFSPFRVSIFPSFVVNTVTTSSCVLTVHTSTHTNDRWGRLLRRHYFWPRGRHIHQPVMRSVDVFWVLRTNQPSLST